MGRKKQDNKNKTVRFRIDAETNKLLIARSLHFFDGNVSAMIRYAIINFKRLKNVDKKKEG
jgi:hypothetical protein